MPLRVLLTGAPSSGKTTLLRSLDQIPWIYTVDETARGLLSEHPEFQTARDFQDVLLRRQLELEENAERMGCPVIVCDRGWIDVIVFSRFFGHEPDRELLGRFKPYDTILLCSYEGIMPTEEDAMRQRPNERKTIHELTLKVVNELGLDYQLLIGSPEKRLHQAIESIRRER